MEVAVDGSLWNVEYHVMTARRLWTSAARSVSWPRQHMRIAGLLVWFLSGSIDLAMLYMHRCRSEEASEAGFFSHRQVAALTMLDWLQDDRTYHMVLTGVDNLDNQYRRVADMFLMDSLVAEYITRMNTRGVTVDLAQTILLLLRLWSYRPRSERVSRWLQKILWHRNTRRHYGVSLRLHFMLCITALPLQQELSQEEITAKVIREAWL